MSMERELGMLIRLLNPYADTMHMTDGDPPDVEKLKQTREADAEAKRIVQKDIDKITVEMETRQVEYLSWQFKDLPRRVKRGLRIAYRHPVRGKNDEILCWVTDHLLVGYEGSNGG